MPAISRCVRMDCPTWMSMEFGRRFFRIKLPDFQSARPAEDGLHSTIVDIFVPRLFCCFVDRASGPLRTYVPAELYFARFPPKSRGLVRARQHLGKQATLVSSTMVKNSGKHCCLPQRRPSRCTPHYVR